MGKRPAAGQQDSQTKKKSKSKYFNHAKKSWHGSGVPTGSRGFLITCVGGKESTSMREAVATIEEQWDIVRGPEDGDARLGSEAESDDSDGDGGCEEEQTNEAERPQSTSAHPVLKKHGVGESGCGGNDIEKLLESEFKQLRDKKQARFQGVDTGCRGIIYVKMARTRGRSSEGEPTPSDLALGILRTVAKEKLPKTRFCMRLLPVEVSVYASLNEIAKAAKPLLEEHFPAGDNQKPLKFSVVYEARAHHELERLVVIEKLALLVPKPHCVDLKEPDKCIVVQVLKNTCMLSVVTEFRELAKYNLQQLVRPAEAEKGAGATDAAGDRGKETQGMENEGVEAPALEETVGGEENNSSGPGEEAGEKEKCSTTAGEEDTAPVGPENEERSGAGVENDLEKSKGGLQPSVG